MFLGDRGVTTAAVLKINYFVRSDTQEYDYKDVYKHLWRKQQGLLQAKTFLQNPEEGIKNGILVIFSLLNAGNKYLYLF